MQKEHLEILLEDIRGKCDRLLSMLAAMSRKVDAKIVISVNKLDQGHLNGSKNLAGDSAKGVAA